jgi:hypothetical protein
LVSTVSSAKRRLTKAAARGALEGGAVAVALGFAGAAAVDAPHRLLVVVGVAAAWAVSTVSVAALLIGRSISFPAFMRAFGAGVALRGAGLAVLMVKAWGQPYEWQASLLAPYALACMVLLLVEFRNLNGVQARNK